MSSALSMYRPGISGNPSTFPTFTSGQLPKGYTDLGSNYQKGAQPYYLPGETGTNPSHFYMPPATQTSLLNKIFDGFVGATLAAMTGGAALGAVAPETAASIGLGGGAASGGGGLAAPIAAQGGGLFGGTGLGSVPLTAGTIPAAGGIPASIATPSLFGFDAAGSGALGAGAAGAGAAGAAAYPFPASIATPSLFGFGGDAAGVGAEAAAAGAIPASVDITSSPAGFSAAGSGGGGLLGALGGLGTVGNLAQLGALGAAAAGGLNTGGGTTTQTPWAPSQPYLLDIMGKAQGLYNNQQPYPGLSPQTQQGQGMISNLASQGSPLLQTAQNTVQNIAAGPQTNPYLDQMFQRGANQIRDYTMGQFTAAGRGGSGANQQQLERNLGDYATQFYGGQYNNDMNRTLAAAQLAPGLNQASYYGPQQLLGAGQLQDQQNLGAYNAPWQQLNNYSGAVTGVGGLGRQVTQPSYSALPALLGSAIQPGGVFNQSGGLMNQQLW